MKKGQVLIIFGMFVLISVFAGNVNAGCILSETDDCPLGTFYGLNSHTCRPCSINYHTGVKDVLISVEQTCLGYKFSGAFQCDPDNQYGCEVNTNIGTFVAPESEADNYGYTDETIDGFDGTITDPDIGDTQTVTIPPMEGPYLSVINGNEPERGDPLTVFSNIRINSECGPLDDFYFLSHEVTLLSGGEEIPLGDNIGVIANKLNSTQLEKLIDEIGQGSETHFRVKIGGKRNIDLNVQLSNCYNFAGKGNKKIVVMRGIDSYKSTDMKTFVTTTSTADVASLMNQASQISSKFYSTDPFKSNIDRFSFFVDLKPYNDRVVPLYAPLSSSCSGGSEYVLLTFNHFVSAFGRQIYCSGIINGASFGCDSSIMHETGHAFCSLEDEYQFKAVDRQIATFILSSKNCLLFPLNPFSLWKYDGKLYGSPWQGCGINTLFRPSDDSLMNSGDKFNTVSCGYCMAAIKGGSAQSYFPECNKMDVEDKGLYP